MIWWRQLIGKTRYFIVAYTYQLADGVITGHGQLTSQVGGGGYVSVDSCIEAVEKNMDDKIATFIVDNIIEMNKKDYTYLMENNTEIKGNEKL